jgi:FixJ family two-component response regulator
VKAEANEPLICIVDDDPGIRRALGRLVESVGLRVETFASPEEFLDTGPAGEVGCLLLDVQLPGMDGFELHDRMIGSGTSVPVIFITAHPSASSRAKARRQDAVAFLEKPFDDQTLFDALEIALDRIVRERRPLTR